MIRLFFIVIVICLSLNISLAQDQFLPELKLISDAPKELQPLARLGSGWAHDLAWSPDDKVIAVASSIGIRLYDAENLDAQPVTLEGEVEATTALAYSPSGDTLATGGDYLRLWDTQTNRLLNTIDTGGRVIYIAFSPDGKSIITSNGFGSETNRTARWDVQTGNLIRVYSEAVMEDLQFTSNGRLLVGLGLGHSFWVQLWNAETGEAKFIGTVTTSLADEDALTFSPDGTKLLAIDRVGNIVLWDIEEEQPYKTTLDDRGEINLWHFAAFTPSGERILAVNDDGSLRIWNAETLELEQSIDLGWQIRDAEPNADRTKVAAIDPSGSIGIWDTTTGNVLGERQNIALDPVIAFSPDGNRIAVSNTIWDVTTGETLAVLNDSRITDIDFSLDGLWMATGNYEGRVSLWDARNHAFERVIVTRESPIVATIFMNSESLLVASQDGLIEVYDIVTNRKIEMSDYPGTNQPYDQLRFPTSSLTSVGVFQNRIVAVSGGLYLWNSTLPELFEPLTSINYSGGLNGLAFDPSANKLAAGGDSKVVQLFDLQTNKFARSITIHDSWIYALAFNPEGTLLASTGCMETLINSWDGTPYCAGAQVKLWNFLAINENPQIDLPTVHTAPVTGVEFNPEGTILVTASDDGTLVLWGVLAEGR